MEGGAMRWPLYLLYAAMAAAVLLGIKAIRASDVNKGIAIGAAQTQKNWDDQKAVDTVATLERERERNADMLTRFRNAERNAYEQAKRDALRERRIRDGDAVADRLRSTIETLNQRDLSTAGTDPSAAAIAGGAATARELFRSCTQSYRSLGAEAERLKDQVIGLQADAMFVCRGTNTQTKPDTNIQESALEPRHD
jgi:hypothetical protein